MRKIKIGKIQNKMLFIGARLSIIDSLLLILQEYLEEHGNASVVNAQNQLTIIIEVLKKLEKNLIKLKRF